MYAISTILTISTVYLHLKPFSGHNFPVTITICYLIIYLNLWKNSFVFKKKFKLELKLNSVRFGGSLKLNSCAFFFLIIDEYKGIFEKSIIKQ